MLNPPYLESVIKQFTYYKALADKTFAQISDQHLFTCLNEERNSIAMLVQHLSGNMVSRWTDFLNSDGEKASRNRDREFEVHKQTREEMLHVWEQGWTCFFNALNNLKEEDLGKIIYIRNQGHTVMEAINRQLAHYPYHIGQIVFLGKLLTQHPWQSLSIPKGKSETFNEQHFAQDKSRTHYTDEFNTPSEET